MRCAFACTPILLKRERLPVQHGLRERLAPVHELEREKRMQKAMLTIKKKFGNNAILKGMNLEEGATAKDRNEQIGGHKA